MTQDELEDLAYEGTELPQNLNYGEALLFLMFRALYEFAKSTHMDPVQGKREKQRILSLCKKYVLDAEYVKYVAELNQRTETARTAYRKSPSAEAASRLVEAIDHIPVKEPWWNEQEEVQT